MTKDAGLCTAPYPRSNGKLLKGSYCLVSLLLLEVDGITVFHKSSYTVNVNVRPGWRRKCDENLKVDYIGEKK